MINKEDSLREKQGKIQQANARGFTLVEAVIAIALFVVIAITAYSAFRSGLLAYGRVEADLGKGYEIKMLTDLMNQELRNAMYYADFLFQGESDSISFPCRLRRYDGKKMTEDLYLVTYRFRSRKLERSEKKWRKKSLREEEGSSESLLELENFRFQFAYKKKNDGVEWRSEWGKKPYLGLPRGIRAILKEKGSSEETMVQILIPHGVLGVIQ
ncbi:MAG: prepilin-type N-terminal cleavage/methylation domain-containing protein [Candidatus Omnitrophica bacterium]|nr:prepilin-type N-terminal cleavage/methylation domain-containing protein [Candidatus Omnitrophota bacterium]